MARRPVSVALCCNNPDNGLFNGSFSGVDIGSEILRLDNKYWPPREPKLKYDFYANESRGFGASKASGRVKVSRKWFPIVGYKYGWGNWCWDLVLMEPEAAIDLLNYLKKLDVFQPEHGETKWFDRFTAEGLEFDKTPTWIRMLEKWGYQKP